MTTNTRLLLLWLSQVARVLGDGCLRLVAMLEIAGGSDEGRLAAFPKATALFIAPFVVLAPLNGCLSNALPRRVVLAGSAAFTLLAVLIFALIGGPWEVCAVLVGAGAAVNSAARYAVLPAAARDAHVPLPRLMGWIELGAAVAVVSSFAIGLMLPHAGWPADGSSLSLRAVAVLAALNLTCLLGVLPASFPSDVRRVETPLSAVVGFFRDLGRIARARAAGPALFGLASFQALVTAAAGPLVAESLRAGEFEGVLGAIVPVAVGLAIGSGVAASIGHPRRCLGLVPLGAVGLAAALAWARGVTSPGEVVPTLPCLALGCMGGLVNAPLRAAYLAAVPPDARGNATAVMNTAIYAASAALLGTLALSVNQAWLTSASAQLLFLLALAVIGAMAAVVLLWLPAVELLLAAILRRYYKIVARGPGHDRIPTSGPVLIVANHSAYFDPLWLGKVVPRRITPMMTSVFYDKPGVRFLMRWVVGAIRVQASRFRREAPELAEAVALLRRDGCLLVFPEAILRRNEEQMLRNFGRGVWHVLREMPDTPVVVCWIEGGWGSFLSYKDGPPGKNKKPDRGRLIQIAVEEARPVPPEILADQRQTRAYLMKACLNCRAYLGLEVPGDVQATDDDEPLTQTTQESSGNPRERLSS